MTGYVQRELSNEVTSALKSLPVVVVSGLRQSGKTTFLRQDAALRGRRYVSLDDWDVLQSARQDPDAFVAGAGPLTIDEAQRCPELMLAIKQQVDRDRKMGQYLLSGSANFLLLRSIGESLAGRAVYLQMPPMTRRELQGRTAATPYLTELFETGRLPPTREFEPITDAEVLLGGFPQLALHIVEDPGIWLRGYEQTYLERDLRELSQVADLMAFRRVLQLAALRSGQVGNESAIGRDAKLAAATTGRYLDLLETSFVLTRLPPFVRGKQQRVIKSPKLYLADSGLAAHLMDVSDLGATERMRGPLYETYVAQNLRGLLGVHLPRSELAFWNVQGRYEVDFVIATARAALAIEVKAGARFEARDLAGLRAFAEDRKDVRACVLAYQGNEVITLDDHLFAIPIGLLLS